MDASSQILIADNDEHFLLPTADLLQKEEATVRTDQDWILRRGCW
jgi:hypothetical protein